MKRIRTRKKQSMEWFYQGSLTIEMTYMIPIFILIIVLFIYTWFYLYNNYVLEQTLERAVITYEREWDMSNSEIEKEMKERIESELALGLFYVKSYVVETSASLLTLEAKGSYQMHVTLVSLINDITGREVFVSSYEATIRRENAAALIRLYRRIKN